MDTATDTPPGPSSDRQILKDYGMQNHLKSSYMALSCHQLKDLCAKKGIKLLEDIYENKKTYAAGQLEKAYMDAHPYTSYTHATLVDFVVQRKLGHEEGMRKQELIDMLEEADDCRTFPFLELERKIRLRIYHFIVLQRDFVRGNYNGTDSV